MLCLVQKVLMDQHFQILWKCWTPIRSPLSPLVSKVVIFRQRNRLWVKGGPAGVGKRWPGQGRRWVKCGPAGIFTLLPYGPSRRANKQSQAHVGFTGGGDTVTVSLARSCRALPWSVAQDWPFDKATAYDGATANGSVPERGCCRSFNCVRAPTLRSFYLFIFWTLHHTK